MNTTPRFSVPRPVRPLYAVAAASAALLVGAFCISGQDAQTKTKATDTALSAQHTATGKHKLVPTPPDEVEKKASVKAKISADAKASAKAEAKADAKARVKAKPAPDRTERTSRNETRGEIHTTDARAWAKAQLDAEQFGCLDALIDAESGWRVDASNPSSGAYGLPQALPGSKMASAGSDWETNGVTQLKWGLGYMKDRYGSPCGAWSFHQANNWY